MKISLLVLLMVVEMTKSMNSYVRGNLPFDKTMQQTFD